MNLNETANDLDQELLDNNKQFIDGVFLTSTPNPHSTLERYVENLNFNSQKFNLSSKNM